MAFLEWTDRLSVNIDTIDRQHQVLVKWMNNFYDAADQNNHSMAKNAPTAACKVHQTSL